jgi:hypothetical protein
MQYGATAREIIAQPNARELMPGLLAAVKHAELQARPLSVLVLSIEAPADLDIADPLAWTLDAVGRSIRRHKDWLSMWTSSPGTTSVAVVLPDTGPRQVAAVRRRLREILRGAQERNSGLHFSLGAASLDQVMIDRQVEVGELLTVAERCRQCALTSGACHLQAVRSSVANGVALSCRHGYAAAELCAEVGAS